MVGLVKNRLLKAATKKAEAFSEDPNASIWEGKAN